MKICATKDVTLTIAVNGGKKKFTLTGGAVLSVMSLCDESALEDFLHHTFTTRTPIAFDLSVREMTQEVLR